MIRDPRGEQNGIPGGGVTGGGGVPTGAGGGAAACGEPDHGNMVLDATSTMPSEVQYQSCGTFQSQLST